MRRDREMFCGLGALVISAGFFAVCMKVSALADAISSHGNKNILTYGMTLVLFCLLFWGGMALTGIKEHRMSDRPGNRAEHPWMNRGVMLAMIAGQALFFAVGLSRENEQVGSVTYKYGWHTQPLVFAIVLFALETVIFFRLYQNVQMKEERTILGIREGEWLCWIVYGVLTILVFYSMDNPNIYGRGESGDNFHAHAYFNSIYNVHWGMPYTSELTSIYGHYALFWKIPMKLIGGDFRKFVWLLAGIGALTHLLAFLVLNQMVKNRLLRIMGALAMAAPILSLRGGYYWQVWPHRMIFPMILLFYALQVFKRRLFRWPTALIGYLICLLAVLWNTETGVLLAIAWAAAHICWQLGQTKRRWKEIFGSLLFHGCGVIGSFLGAYGIVNGYNLLKHSPANTLQEFLIPLLSSDYMEDVLHLDLPSYPSSYMAVIPLLLVGTALGIAAWFQRKKDMDWQTALLFFLSISALGRLTYYMNRPAYYNLDCCIFSIVILLAWLGQQGLSFVRKGQWSTLSVGQVIRGTEEAVCVTVLLALSTGMVLQFSQNSQIKENFHNREEFNALLTEISEQVPPNTFGFGLNIAEIYSSLHWNSQCFTMDFSDLFTGQESAFRVENQLKEQDVDLVFTSAASLPTWERFNPEGYQWFMDTYTVDKTFTIKNEIYQLYKKSEE